MHVVADQLEGPAIVGVNNLGQSQSTPNWFMTLGFAKSKFFCSSLCSAVTIRAVTQTTATFTPTLSYRVKQVSTLGRFPNPGHESAITLFCLVCLFPYNVIPLLPPIPAPIVNSALSIYPKHARCDIVI